MNKYSFIGHLLSSLSCSFEPHCSVTQQMLCCISRRAACIVTGVPTRLSLLVDSPYVGSSGAAPRLEAFPSLVQRADSPRKDPRCREQNGLPSVVSLFKSENGSVHIPMQERGWVSLDQMLISTPQWQAALGDAVLTATFCSPGVMVLEKAGEAMHTPCLEPQLTVGLP